MHLGVATHRGLFRYELSGLDSPEQEIEYLKDERVPAVEHGVGGRARGDREEKIEKVRLGKGADEFALQRRKLCLVGAEVHVGREVPDECEIPDEMEDDVDDLHVALRPRFGAAGETGQGDAEQRMEDARSEQGRLVVQMALQELGVVRAAVELLVELLELLRQVDWPCHRSDQIGACDGSFVLDVTLAGRLEDDGDEVVGEDARCPQDASDGAFVVRIVLPPKLL